MNKEPVICFYKNSSFIVSTNFKLISYNNLDWELFLSDINKKYFNNLKILKINYEAGAIKLLDKKFDKKKLSLFKDNLVDIFILFDFKIISSNRLNEYLKYQNNFNLINKFTPLILKESYKDYFKTIKKNIINGYYYQINYTFPFKATYKGSALSAFNYYHNKFKGQYHAYLPLNNASIISCSPELFISKDDKNIKSMPIKGTSFDTNTGINKLLNSSKEDAELSMIVDLVRNDLNSIADISFSKVINHRKILKLGNLAHTYSTVTAKTSYSLDKILLNILPGASISGCPKSSSVLSIQNLETYKRNFYTGHLGWWYKNNCMLNVLIRSFIFLKENLSFFYAGGGIVYDSKINSEYKEVFLKGEKINA